MRMQLNRLAASASVIALAAVGTASALTIGSATIGGQATPYQLANELNFAHANASAALVARVQPTTGSLPVGNVFLHVGLSNAVFPTALTGGAVQGFDHASAANSTDCANATASISSGGTANSSSVVFLVSNAQGCEMTTTAVSEGLQFTGTIRPTGAGTVVLTTNITTDPAGEINVDQGAATRGIITVGSGFNVAVSATGAGPVATLPTFTSFGGGGAQRELGEIAVILGNPTATPPFAPNTSYTGTAIAATDIASITVSVEGDFSPYNSTSGSTGTIYLDLDNSDTAQANERLTVAGSTASRTFTAPADIAAVVGTARAIRVAENGTTAILASPYTATITLTPSTTSSTIPFRGEAEVTTANLRAVTREGATVLMAWFASGTQAGITGSNNLVRIGNLGANPVNAVYAQIVSSAATGTFTNPGNVLLSGITIPARGSILLSSQQLEDLLGVNWVTGDIRFTLEALQGNITARRLVFNGTNLTDITNGN